MVSTLNSQLSYVLSFASGDRSVSSRLDELRPRLAGMLVSDCDATLDGVPLDG